ncbi:chaperone modulator CbpM [Sinorhizobium fredii]|uniref:MerR family transcriptional regulator n=2 Tax=Rhizobium fredii TaxID=380 RepID=A0A844ALK4_RHIFR|nr:chaperone modulator CbpM [Sinorhizobium fredii]MQX11741.1 MerR family transcriptional regulator [Sinorhizobium fredii]MQX11900.1 MerR family transcriptional regulator [Sinorhizobium fredii]MQX11906.1 MerR family transcriptional regulator [Sinorhizobium fredii]MQX12551.1 MerR family transcriptional regulator [Sinorhizobium fredii]
MRHSEFCERLSIEHSTLSIWMEQGWVVPAKNDGRGEFHDADVARGLLILDLSETMGVNHEGIDVIMALVDQVHGLRSKIQALTDAIRDQDEQVQRQILQSLERSS